VAARGPTLEDSRAQGLQLVVVAGCGWLWLGGSGAGADHLIGLVGHGAQFQFPHGSFVNPYKSWNS